MKPLAERLLEVEHDDGCDLNRHYGYACIKSCDCTLPVRQEAAEALRVASEKKAQPDDLREKLLARALQQALKLSSNRCREILYEEHGEILRWLQGYK